jgi:hypothetical protein
MRDDWQTVLALAEEDIAVLKEKEKTYGQSWKLRGGIGAFMMLARKWDRIENQVKKVGYDIFMAWEDSVGMDGFEDDVNDLIRYLTLVRLEMASREEGFEPGSSYTNQDQAGSLLDK